MLPITQTLKWAGLGLVLALGLAGTGLRPTAALAGEQPNLLVVGDDADQDTVPRNSRVFNRVVLAMSDEMYQLGFKVYDETAASMDITPAGRVRRTDAELLSIAQRIQQPPIDALVVFQIYASVQKNNYADIQDLSVRIPGRMINVQTGQFLGNFEVAYGPKDLPPLPPNCNRDCVLEHVGNQAKSIAHDVGAVLAQKLAMISPARPQHPIVNGPVSSDVGPSGGALGSGPAIGGPVAGCTGLTTGYTLAFRGFDPQEIGRIEEYLTAFKGYDHHRPVRNQLRSVEYWYETCSDLSRLDRNIRMTFEQMGIDVRVSLRGNRFEVDRFGPPAIR